MQTVDYEGSTSLYFLDDTYYLHVAYDQEAMDEDSKADLFSLVSEFATTSNMTIHRLEEYGKVIMDADVFKQIVEHFE